MLTEKVHLRQEDRAQIFIVLTTDLVATSYTVHFPFCMVRLFALRGTHLEVAGTRDDDRAPPHGRRSEQRPAPDGANQRVPADGDLFKRSAQEKKRHEHVSHESFEKSSLGSQIVAVQHLTDKRHVDMNRNAKRQLKDESISCTSSRKSRNKLSRQKKSRWHLQWNPQFHPQLS